MEKKGDPCVYERLEKLNIAYSYYEHPPAPTAEIAAQYWKDIEAAHCKNLFFRNHKGNQHYLVIFHYLQNLLIRDLEQRLKQGKLSFASPERMYRYLKITPGSVSPFGLIHDENRHIIVFLDENLQKYDRISFHPNLNEASLVISFADFLRYMQTVGNTYSFLSLY